MERKIAIIRDGYSDYLVLKSFVSSIFKTEQNITLEESDFIDFEDLKIGEAIEEYIDKANKDGEDSLTGNRAISLKNSIITTLYTALQKHPLSHKSVLILNADAEHKLMSNENYFEEWVQRLYSIINLAIQEFYHKMVMQHYTYDNLPIIIPLILFPSIEIFVASCYLADKEQINIRTLRAKPDLKIKVWDTDNIPYAINSGKMNEVLSLCFGDDNNSTQDIYRHIPEARQLIHILSYPHLV